MRSTPSGKEKRRSTQQNKQAPRDMPSSCLTEGKRFLRRRNSFYHNKNSVRRSLVLSTLQPSLLTRRELLDRNKVGPRLRRRGCVWNKRAQPRITPKLRPILPSVLLRQSLSQSRDGAVRKVENLSAQRSGMSAPHRSLSNYNRTPLSSQRERRRTSHDRGWRKKRLESTASPNGGAESGLRLKTKKQRQAKPGTLRIMFGQPPSMKKRNDHTKRRESKPKNSESNNARSPHNKRHNGNIRRQWRLTQLYMQLPYSLM